MTNLDYTRRHLRFGWWSVLVFSTLGLVLETLHGFKVRAYVDVSNDTRRLMWTLAHAHGTGLGLLNVVFGLYLSAFPDINLRNLKLISTSLVAASIVLPGGFFLGGIAFYSGDPGVGILLVPAGAVLLVAAVFYIARGAGSEGRAAQLPQPRAPRSR